VNLSQKRARLVVGVGATCLGLLAAGQPLAVAAEAPGHAKPAHAQRSLPGGNLILNPGAEAGVGGDLPSWDTTPGFVAESYGAEFRPGVEVSQAIGGGAQLFAGGSESTISYGTQVIDVSSAAEEIDGGGIAVNLSAYLGGIDAEGDYAQVSAFFLPASGGQPLRTPLTVGPVTAADRGNQTKLLLRSALSTLPVGTRRIQITITSTRVDGTYTDGYADNLSLNLAFRPGSTTVTRIKASGRRVKGKIAAKAPCKSGRKVVLKKGSKTIASAKSKGSGKFTLKSKKHKKGKLTIKVSKRTVGSTTCAASTKKVPGRH
jgi:hypothetical protein